MNGVPRWVRLRLPDPGRRFTRVDLDCHGLGGPCTYAGGAWERVVAPGAHRLEYQFAVRRGRRLEHLLDPDCPHQVDTPFGLRSEWRASSYRAPTWLDDEAVAGRRRRLALPSALAGPLPVELWEPEGLRRTTSAPLIWCHDGGDYARRAALLQWVGSGIHAGWLPPTRVALADPVHRMSWYSGSTRYLRSVDRALATLGEQYAVRGLAVMGASLGGLTSLLVALRRTDVDAVLTQSGSFFDAALDGGPEPFRHYARVHDLVQRMRTGRLGHPRPGLRVALTCGAAEGNNANNHAMARALAEQGMTLRQVDWPDRHSYTSWRDCLDPIWRETLQDAWSAAG